MTEAPKDNQNHFKRHFPTLRACLPNLVPPSQPARSPASHPDAIQSATSQMPPTQPTTCTWKGAGGRGEALRSAAPVLKLAARRMELPSESPEKGSPKESPPPPRAPLPLAPRPHDSRTTAPRQPRLAQKPALETDPEKERPKVHQKCP